MAGTPGQAAFQGYVNATDVEDALPWADQDQKSWEKAATSVKVEAAEPPGAPEELHMDAAHAEGG